jgi:hypothetical protein
LSDTAGYLLADIIVMGGLASNDRSEAEQRSVFATVGELLCSLRNFTGARHPDYGYLFVSGTMTLEAVYRAGKQF